EPAQEDPLLQNNLGYFPPALALVVKGTSRIHTNVGGMLSPRPGAPPGGMGALPGNNREGALVIAPSGRSNPLNRPNDQLAKSSPARESKPPVKEKELRDKLKDDKDRAALAQLDPKKIWQEALAKGVTDPGLIIAVADFLAEHEKYDHVAEFLKANLRLGI